MPIYAVAGHCQYVLYWIAIFPPVAMFLYGRKTGRLLSLAHIALMLLLIILFYKSWSAAGFRIEATYNIFGVNAALIVLIDYFEKCREYCDKELLEANEELKSTNEALKHNETQLRLILDSTDEAIFGIDTDGRCTFCNASCVKLLGYKERDDLLGQNMCNIVHNIFYISENRNKFLEGQSGIEMKEDVFVKKGGTYFNVRYSSYPQ